MIKVTWDQGFKRIYKKKIKNNDGLKKKFWDVFLNGNEVLLIDIGSHDEVY